MRSLGRKGGSKGWKKEWRVERVRVYQASIVIIGREGIRGSRGEGSSIGSLCKELAIVGNP